MSSSKENTIGKQVAIPNQVNVPYYPITSISYSNSSVEELSYYCENNSSSINQLLQVYSRDQTQFIETTSKDLELTPSFFSEEFKSLMTSLLDGSSYELEKEITINFSQVTNVHEIRQNKVYRIPEEIYKNWPKIYGIDSDQNNKQIITLLFRNSPDLKNIINILIFSDTEFKLEEYGRNVQNIILEKNADQALINLYFIYSNFSQEAASLLWEAFLFVLEGKMDNENPRWKNGKIYQIDSWAEEIQNENDSCHTLTSASNKDCLIKHKYNLLSFDDKQKFRKSIIAYSVKIQAALEMEQILKIDKQDLIEKSLDTPEKCHVFINNNLNNLSNTINHLEEYIQNEVTRLFEPGISEFFKSLVSKRTNKKIKTTNGLARSSLSLSQKMLQFSETSSRFLGKLYPFFDTLNICTSFYSLFLEEHFEDKNEKDTKEKEEKIISIQDLAKLFIDRNVICNHEEFESLTPDSKSKISQFYAEYITLKVNNDPSLADKPYITTHLLHNITDIEYLKHLGLGTKTQALLDLQQGQKISIANFLLKQNQTECYEHLHDFLKGKAVNSSELNNEMEELPMSLAFNEDTTISLQGEQLEHLSLTG